MKKTTTGGSCQTPCLQAALVNQCTSAMTRGSNSWRATGSGPQARRSATGRTLWKMAWNWVGCAAKSWASRVSGLQGRCPWVSLAWRLAGVSSALSGSYAQSCCSHSKDMAHGTSGMKTLCKALL